MLVLPLVCLSFLQLSVAQQQYGAGLLSSLFSIPKFCFCRCGLQKRPEGWFTSVRDPVSPSQFPWLVTVQAGDQTIFGSLISDRHVLTVASPLYRLPVSNISLRLGASDYCDSAGLATRAEAVLINPSYSPTNLDNDIAIIQLPYVVPFSDSISPICLPFPGYKEDGKVGYSVTWSDSNGNSSCSSRLVSLPFLSARACLMGSVNMSLVTGDKGCLGPVGSNSVLCEGDIGAPVMAQWLSGTSFHIIGLVSSSACESVTTPLFTRVADHLSWINAQIRSACQCFSKF